MNPKTIEIESQSEMECEFIIIETLIKGRELTEGEIKLAAKLGREHWRELQEKENILTKNDDRKTKKLTFGEAVLACEQGNIIQHQEAAGDQFISLHYCKNDHWYHQHSDTFLLSEQRAGFDLSTDGYFELYETESEQKPKQAFWNKWPEEKPKSADYYLIKINGRNCEASYFSIEREWFSSNLPLDSSKIAAWAEIPELDIK